MNNYIVLRRNHWVVKILCFFRGFGLFAVEAARVQYDTTTYVRVFRR